MAPTGGETGARNANLLIRLGIGNERSQRGIVFDSSTGFHLPNGADRSPGVAWVRRDRWPALTPQQREKFPPLAPDFVMELMSPSDILAEAQVKIEKSLMGLPSHRASGRILSRTKNLRFLNSGAATPSL